MTNVQLNCYRPTDRCFNRVMDWAQDQYQTRIGNTIGRYPDHLIAITDRERILGCIGLNEGIYCPLFMHDPDCQERLYVYGPGACCEQAVLLVDPSYPRALPLLIAAVTFQAYVLGYPYLMYAGISESIKTVEKLGLHTQEIGTVDLAVLPPDMRDNYVQWHTANAPVYFALQTQSAVAAQQLALSRYAKKRVAICQALQPANADPVLEQNLVQAPAPILVAAE